MAETFVAGEFRRTLDRRFRLSIPPELLSGLQVESKPCLLAKERPGALSLWPLNPWEERFRQGVELIQQRFRAGRLSERIADVQAFGRLVSTRARQVQLAGRGRLVIPEGFREFLAAEPESDLLVVGAAICIEIWRPDVWAQQLAEEIPRFYDLYDDLSS